MDRFSSPTATLALALLSGSAFAGTVSLSDGDFSPLNWTATEEADSEGTATFSAGQQVAGGNPGAHWQVTHNYGPRVTQTSASITVSHISSALTFDPMPGNYITSVSVSFDVDVITHGESFVVGFGPALVQGGILYFGPNTVQAEGPGWTTRSFLNLVATDFSAGMANPDFSTGGAPITFGFWTSNGTGNASPTSTTTDYDNFSATLTTVPEPATVALLGLAPAVLAWRRWTQRRR